ncbi:ABC transporter permease [Clostridium ganghwense]|uniref:Iron ABC transporter permease n=1 Tax=Clostridium ganghwense TaxID=312089 RepID=A0ABT4CJR0_9CLOT|nr:iron ABC transporter permease [Clostridium ganghwense]MCY6369290.1 iron ABC transporter permease [Clostridium ganghwense]
MSEISLKEKKGLKFDLKNVIKEPALLIVLLILALTFIIFILYPFLKVLSIPNKAEWVRVFTEKEFLVDFAHTMFSSLLATTSAIVIGFIYAYAMNYTDIPGKKFFRIIALIPIMAPSVITGLAFIMLFGRRGFITYHLLNLKVDLYGWVGLWIVQTIAFFPLAYMTISGVLKSISPNLELAAQNLGARGFTLFRTVTLKLATPGILSAFLLVAINAFADFGNPMLVGGNYRVLATEAYMQVTGNWDMGVAAILSVMLVIPTLIVFLIQKYYLDRKSYVTVTGKPVAGLKRDAVSPLVKWILFIICSIVALIIILIFAVIIGYAVTKNFGVNNTFTLYNIKEGILNSSAIKNSWILALATAIITTILGLVIAFVVSRKRFPGKGAMDFLAMLPVSLPGTFIGLALILAFNDGPLPLTGTAAIVVLGMSLRQLPVGYRNAISAFKQIDKSIEEASTNLGANSVVTFRKVVMPMLKNAFSTSFVYSFMKSMNTLSTVIFLVVPQWMLASVKILSLSDHGFYGVASATALGMVLTILITFGIVKLIFRNKINIFEL